MPGLNKATYIEKRPVALPCGHLVCTSCLDLDLPGKNCSCPICKEKVNKLSFLTDEELKNMYKKIYTESHTSYFDLEKIKSRSYPSKLIEGWPFYPCGDLFDKPAETVGNDVHCRLSNALYRDRRCCCSHYERSYSRILNEYISYETTVIFLPSVETKLKLKLKSRYVAFPCGHFNCMPSVVVFEGTKGRCPQCHLCYNPDVFLNDEELLSAYGEYVRSDENGKEYLDESLKSKIGLTLWARVSNALIVKNGRTNK